MNVNAFGAYIRQWFENSLALIIVIAVGLLSREPLKPKAHELLWLGTADSTCHRTPISFRILLATCLTLLYPHHSTAMRMLPSFRQETTGSHFHSDFFNENRWEKFTRRIKEEPLVPFGSPSDLQSFQLAF